MHTRSAPGRATRVAIVIGAFAVALFHGIARDPIQAAIASLGPHLEHRFQRSAIGDTTAITGIVVLGGGTSRAQEALLLARRHPQARVILSGASAAEQAILASSPDVLTRLSIDHRARDTYDNARYSRALATPKPGERWLLVTSALHMPRSMGVFQAARFPVDPWPVRDTPQLAAIAAPAVQHEILGLIYYRLIGRTHLLLPG